MVHSDNILLERFVRGGDSEAFSELVQVYAGLVYGTCFRVLTDRASAADATQETFFQLLKHAGDITGSVAGWLHRVATHKAVDMIRRDSSRRRREVEYVSERAIDRDNWDEISPYVDEALAELDADVRHVLTEHFLSGRSMTDIAAGLEVSQPAVSMKIKDGLTQLRGMFRRRGLLVGAAVLGVMLTENTAVAAPVGVLNELRKMAIVSGASAAVSTGSAGAATAGGAKAVAGAAFTAVKAKVVTGVAIAAIGAGAVVTYDQVQKRADRPGSAVTTTQQYEKSATSSRGAGAVQDDEWDGFWEEIEREEAAAGSSTVVGEGGFAAGAEEAEAAGRERDDGSGTRQVAAAPIAGMGVGGKSAAADDPNDSTEEEAQPAPTMYYYSGPGRRGRGRSSK